MSVFTKNFLTWLGFFIGGPLFLIFFIAIVVKFSEWLEEKTGLDSSIYGTGLAFALLWGFLLWLLIFD